MHENCKRCKLHEGCVTPFMESAGSDEPLVLVVGEMPNSNDDFMGKPFTGELGDLVRDTLEDAGFDPDTIRYTNVARCFPDDTKLSKRHINLCKHFVVEEIQDFQPSLVFLLGGGPLNALLGQSSISQWNGVVVERDEAIYVPLYHPNYVMNNPTVMGEWIDGIDKALDTVLNGSERTGFSKVYPMSVQAVKDMRDNLVTCDLVSYDTETGDLDAWHPDNSIPCVSFAGGGVTYAVPIDHIESPWTDEEYDIVLDIVEEILSRENAKFIGHNMKFDQLHTRHMFGIEYETYGDTMLVSHMLDSRRGIHSLKRLAGLHLGMFDYDKPLEDYKKANPECNPARGGSYTNIPLKILLPYAALDTEATLKLWHVLYPQLSNKQKTFYHEVVIPASNALAEMEFNGNAIDDFIAKRYVKIYNTVQQRLYRKIMELPEVKHVVDYFQNEKDVKLIEGLPTGSEWEMTPTHVEYVVWKEDYNGKPYQARKGKRKRTIVEFNPNSPFHLRRLYFHELDIQSDAYTESGHLSTSADTMKTYVTKYPVVEDIIHYKLLTKMLGTYLIPAAGLDPKNQWKSGDGRVRSTYNLHGTRTGRLSSSNPNMQNIPTPEKEADNRPQSVVVHLPIKNVFTHTYPGGVLMSVDYSGMELRVFASLAHCMKMIDIHKSGADFHSMVAILAQTGRQVADITVEETKRYKRDHHEIRYRYKWTNWTLLYGGDKYTLMNLYGMTEQEADSTVESYYDTFPEVLDFRTDCIEFAQDYGYIESPFGRREQLHYITDKFDKGKRNKDKRSAVNMPVQSSASDILLCALIVINHKLKTRGMRTMLVNTVHDSIVLDVPPEEIDDVAGICVDVMENITTYARTYFPNVDFSWLKSPLKADVEVGTHYGTEISYSEWLANGRSMYAKV